MEIVSLRHLIFFVAMDVAFQFFNIITVIGVISAKIDGWDTAPNTQYHIQTDEGPERYFRYQTISGQYRKEKRLQDGTVVGSYGWVDADGYLRLNDYVADTDGYRVVRTKRLYVGTQAPEAKFTPATVSSPSKDLSKAFPQDQSKLLVFPSTPAPVAAYTRRRPTPPIGYYPSSTPPSIGYYPSSTPPSIRYYSSSPSSHFSQDDDSVAITPSVPTYKAPLYTSVVKQNPSYNRNSIDTLYFGQRSSTDSRQPYDGVSVTRNGFQYYLPRQYHEEETSPGDKRVGSFGYIDPFGIRRVIYYNSAPGTGFVHRKNNRYVGFNDTPYDPRP